MSKELDFERLRLLAYKLRCLGYFEETQDPNHTFPVDFDKVQYGFSLFLNEITAEIVEIAEEVGTKKEEYFSGRFIALVNRSDLNEALFLIDKL